MNLMQAVDIENQTVSQVHLLNLLHILPGKSNIVNRNVFPNPVSMYRLGNGHDLILQKPPQNDLSRRLSIDLTNFR